MSNEQNRNNRMRQQIMRQQGTHPLNSARDLSKHMDSLPSFMRPGNVGAINEVIWPFWFTGTAPELAPGSSGTSFTTITQEAAFVMMAYTKAVYKRSGVLGSYVYTFVDSLNEEAVGQTDGLAFTIKDSASTRTFHNKPLEIDQVGGGEFPSVLPTPIMFLPNSNIEITYNNNNATDTYVPFITFFGYRVRVDEAQKLLSTVTG